MLGKDWPDLATRAEAVSPAATIEYIIHRKVETAINFAAYGEQEVCNAMKEVHGERDGVKTYVKPPKIFQSSLLNL